MLNKLTRKLNKATNIISEKTAEQQFHEAINTIKSLIQKEVPDVAKETLVSDEGSLMVAKVIHPLLPIPLPLVISEEKLANYLKTNSEKIFS